MRQDALQDFVARVRASWGPLSTRVAAECRDHLSALLQAEPAQPWLASLLADRPAKRELHRDPDHGFVLLAHTETEGLYRPPHDHGRGWVLYGVQSGEVEMGGYARIEDPDGQARLVRRDVTLVRPGMAMTYLPGDIHDTRCVSHQALLFRFAAIDLQREDKVEGRVTRYVEQDGVFRVARP